MKNKTVIHEFDPVIYPVKLWVIITINYEPLTQRFYEGLDKKPLDIDFIQDHEAVTCLVQSKETKNYGVLIVFCGHKYCKQNNITHETAHAVDFIWEHICEKNPGDEANAYLSGWIAECCEKVKNSKV